MAISVPGPLVGAVSGKLGSITFVATAKGNVIRDSGRNPFVGSIRQLSQQSKMLSAQLRWQTLSNAQRLQWDTAAPSIAHRDRFGRQNNMSGFQLYCAVNGISKLFDTTFHDTPPTTFHRYTTPIVSTSFSASGAYDLVPGQIPIVGVALANVWVARPLSTKTRKFFRRWIACGCHWPVPPYYPMNTIIEAAVGELTEGEVVGIRYGMRAWGGLLGHFTETHVTVAA